MERNPPTGSAGRLLTVGLVLLVTAVAFEGLAVPTVLPATLDELGGLPFYGWAFSGYWLTSLVGITLAGIESDRRGPIRAFVLATLLFAGGLIIAAAAPSMPVVAAGRAIQGLGSGAISALIYVAIARGYPPAAQPRMIAIISSAWVLPGLVGPFIAGVLTEAFSWRWVFGALVPLVPLAAAVVMVPLARLRAGGAAQQAAPARVRDALGLVAGSAVLLGALSLPAVAAVLVGALGLVVAARSTARLLPAGTLTARRGRAAAVASLALVSIAFLGAEAFVPLAVASVRGAGAVVGGLSLTSAAVTWAAGSWVQARLAGRGIRRGMVLAGFGLVMVGIGLETWVPLSASAPIWLAAGAWGIAGLGMGLAYSTTTLVAIETAPPGAEGAASAGVQLANTLGIAVGTGVTGALVAGIAAGPGLAAGIAVANLAMLLVCLLGLLAAQGIHEPPGLVGHRVSAPLDHGPAL